MPLPPSNEQRDVVSRITAKLAQLGHDVSFAKPVTTGPIVTTYRFVPSGGTKVAQLAALTDDLAIALEAEDVLIRRLSGEGAIGISVPNRERRPVLWRNTMSVPERLDPDLELRPPAAVPLNMGVLDWQGYPFRDDLAAMPHLLIVGSTNSGKSTWMLGALASLIFWLKPYGPGAVQLALSDTKCVEFHQFDGAPHLWCDIATSPEATWQMMDRLLEINPDLDLHDTVRALEALGEE